MRELFNPSEGHVRIRGAMHREEAIVVQSYLEANDIPAWLVPVASAFEAYTRQAPMNLELWVGEERAEEAELLLSQEVVADPGDAGPE